VDIDTAQDGPDLADGAASVTVGVLGLLRLEVNGTVVEVPGVMRRAVLALLALAGPEGRSHDSLVDALWPDEPPSAARNALQSHVSRLRRHLGPAAGRLTNTAAGYRLHLEPDECDATAALALLDEARARVDDDPEGARVRLVRALDHWRGPALADLREFAPLAAWARSLTERWLEAGDLAVTCALRTGDIHTAVSVAAAAASADPLREASAINLVRALAADGRHAEALRTANAFRKRLAEETGLDPSAALAAVEREVLDSDGLSATESVASVPRAPTPTLIGRQRELAGLGRLLESERLVTLVGPGGVGKTSLALAAAHRAGDTHQVAVVALAPVSDPESVPSVVAQALGLRSGDHELLDRCALRLAAGRHLLVVDNCEHLRDAAADTVEYLLDRCAGLTVLATSRERLAVPAEQVCPLDPLGLPGVDGEDEMEAAAVTMFLERARRARPGWVPDEQELASIAKIVRRVDGLPLAIELAAGRLSTMGVGELESRLDRVLDILAVPGRSAHRSAAERRHRTLRSAIEWSYDLLSPDEQRLFRHMALTPDGCSLSAVEELAAWLELGRDPASHLAALVDTSMVVASHGDGGADTRYRMLDSLRTFGTDRLAAEGEEAAATERFVAHTVSMAASIRADLAVDEIAADRQLRVEFGNLRAAWHLVRQRGDLDSAVAILSDLYLLAMWRDLVEIWAWAAELVEDPALSAHPGAARTLAIAAEGAWYSAGDLDAAARLAARAEQVLRPGGPDASFVQVAMGDVQLLQGRFDEAERCFLAATADAGRAAEAFVLASMAAAYGGRPAQAADHLARADPLPMSTTIDGFARYMRGELQRLDEQWIDALDSFAESRRVADLTGATFLESITAVSTVSVHAAAGHVRDALAGYLDLIDYWERTGGWTQQWTTLRNLADLLDQLGDGAEAAALRRAADAAPEAAAVGSVPAPRPEPVEPPDRAQSLVLARTAIHRRLDRLDPDT
jgi:predicted ATPase/DNA-binding SARP family transcriptional activator